MNEAVAELESVVCNACGADDPVVIYPSTRGEEPSDGEFRSSGDEALVDPLVKCRRCGLQYVTPRPKAEDVLRAYAEAVDETFVSQAKGRELTFARCLREIEKAWRQPPGSVLDVGT
ncbi:hypothetical protein ACFLSJ_07190, partial [Verrucomicrobiota bacterium]